MTINEAIDALDTRKSNTFSRQDKLTWLSRLDGLIQAQVIDTHAGGGEGFPGYTDDTDPDTTLLVPAPWDEIYLRYMEAQIDYANGDLTRYANSAALYNGCLTEYKNHYHRTHAPKGTQWRYF